MRILQLTPRLPHPPLDGGRVVMQQIAVAMQRLGAEVHVLSLNPRKQRADVAAARQALATASLAAVDIDTSAHARAVVRALRMGVPFVVARFYSHAFERELRNALRSHPVDVVQVESPFLLPYVPVIREVSNARVVLRSLNVEFRIWEQLASSQKNPFRALALHGVARSLRRYEVAHLNTCDALVPITEDDAREFRALGCTRPIHVLPGGVDLEEHAVDHRTEEPMAVGFLASLDYRPNQDAAIWIAEELRPRLAALHPHAWIRLAGSNAPSWLTARMEAAGVKPLGRVPDAAAFIRSMRVMLAPVFSGGGMRIKILEAMALGKPVVATTASAAGIDLEPGRDILIADDAGSFAAAVASLLRDESVARAIGDAGRRVVEGRFSSEALGRGLLAFYEQLPQGGHEASGR